MAAGVTLSTPLVALLPFHPPLAEHEVALVDDQVSMLDGWDTAERLAGHIDRVIPGHDPLVSQIYPRVSDAADVFALHRTPSQSFAK